MRIERDNTSFSKPSMVAEDPRKRKFYLRNREEDWRFQYEDLKKTMEVFYIEENRMVGLVGLSVEMAPPKTIV